MVLTINDLFMKFEKKKYFYRLIGFYKMCNTIELNKQAKWFLLNKSKYFKIIFDFFIDTVCVMPSSSLDIIDV